MERADGEISVTVRVTLSWTQNEQLYIYYSFYHNFYVFDNKIYFNAHNNKSKTVDLFIYDITTGELNILDEDVVEFSIFESKILYRKNNNLYCRIRDSFYYVIYDLSNAERKVLKDLSNEMNSEFTAYQLIIDSNYLIVQDDKRNFYVVDFNGNISGKLFNSNVTYSRSISIIGVTENK